MSVIFSILDEHKAVLISISGLIAREDIELMRIRTLEIANETKFTSFIMDIGDLQSIEHGNASAVFELGSKFRSTGFPLQAKTAVIMPSAAKAREQVEFLHTVEINRGRGELKYVDNIDDGLYWFRSSST